MSNSTTKRSNLSQTKVVDEIAKLPWWILFIAFLGVLIVFMINTDTKYNNAFKFIINGIGLTVQITLCAYLLAITLGFLTALGQLSKNVFLRNLTTLYVQLIRGVPMLVQVFYVGFVVIPAVINLLASFGLPKIDIAPVWRAIFALALGYGAFSSEIFRAGIQSIERGQIEAAQSLGLRPFQTLRFIILPQAIRRVLPPLGNDFISMLKESSLASAVGANEITNLGKQYVATSFNYPETYNTLAFMYLSMTLLLSMVVRWLEGKMKIEGR
ncbi:MAG TPA: amino acid ABC transporter permease [Anaerolineales bacterium]|nr:amino acid ABC transporter permease [Anaerolineales bacterium]